MVPKTQITLNTITLAKDIHLQQKPHPTVGPSCQPIPKPDIFGFGSLAVCWTSLKIFGPVMEPLIHAQWNINITDFRITWTPQLVLLQQTIVFKKFICEFLKKIRTQLLLCFCYIIFFLCLCDEKWSVSKCDTWKIVTHLAVSTAGPSASSRFRVWSIKSKIMDHA